MSNSNIACAILAGGKNTRMKGENKAFIKLDKQTIFESISNELENVFAEILVVTNSPQEYQSYNDKYNIITDKIKNVGPLGGIHSALFETTKEAIFVVSCDMPYLNMELIKKEMKIYHKINCDVIVPKIGTFFEPLHSIYKKALYTKLHSFIDQRINYQIKAFLDIVNVHYWDLENNNFHHRAFTNINTPDDLRKAMKN